MWQYLLFYVYLCNDRILIAKVGNILFQETHYFRRLSLDTLPFPPSPIDMFITLDIMTPHENFSSQHFDGEFFIQHDGRILRRYIILFS